jgi:glutamate-1-semialdehyde 2,1-aminomutase
VGDISRSIELFDKACGLMPGGVNSPVRAFKSVGLNPLFIQNAQGSKIYDADGNEYIDYVCSWGPLILGHTHPDIVKAISSAASRGTSYGAPCEQEIELAELICKAIPSVEKIRMVNSGTEATMSAVRLARAYTGRNKIIKFEGCYHGHADTFLIKAGSGLMTAGIPTSPGVPFEFAQHTLVGTYNSLESVEKLFCQYPGEIAAVIVEPVAGNMGLVPPDGNFLPGLRSLTRENGSLLIFDEVITGFRTTYGGFQNLVDIQPDLTTLGKIIGGGLPVGAYGGRKEIMDQVAPQGNVYQAGTLSGNPLAMAAGITTLKLLRDSNPYQQLQTLTQMLTSRIRSMLEARGLKYRINTLGSMFSIFFTDRDVSDYNSAVTCDTTKYARFYKELLQKGIYFPPSQFEVCFVSCSHDQGDIDKTADAIDQALDRI